MNHVDSAGIIKYQNPSLKDVVSTQAFVLIIYLIDMIGSRYDEGDFTPATLYVTLDRGV